MKYLTVCMNFKDEAPYLKEWIEYHIKVGVDHFILYNHNSKDNYKQVLQPYINKKMITLLNCNAKRVKHYTYPNTVNKFYKFSKWIAFIDCDEFLVPGGNCLKKELEKFERYPGVHICSKFFGSNGHVKKPSGGVLKNFTKRRDDSNSKKVTVKSIINPRLTIPKCMSPHWFSYVDGKLPVDTKGRPITRRYKNSQAHLTEANYLHIHLNHYWCRSYEEYMKKHNKPNDSTGEDKRKGDAKVAFDNYNKSANAIEDKNILRFLK